MYNTGVLNLCKQCLRHTQVLQSLSLHYVVTMTKLYKGLTINSDIRYYIIYIVHLLVHLLVHVLSIYILSILLNIVSATEL